MSTFKGYEMMEDIQNENLQAYNRANVVRNIYENSPNLVLQYMNNFNHREQELTTHWYSRLLNEDNGKLAREVYAKYF